MIRTARLKGVVALFLMMAGLGYGVWPCPSVRDRIQNAGQISQSRVSPDLHLNIQALLWLVPIG